MMEEQTKFGAAMNSRYIFRQIEKEEISQMFSMILQRMKWMDDKGIKQWNEAGYDEIYPQSYYEEAHKKGEAFVLADSNTNEIISAAVLKEEDNRWKDKEPAIYLHNFVSKIGKKGAGAIFLQRAEEYAARKEKKYVRLDSAENNQFLAYYYEQRGFEPVGKCEDGLYKGILRQKKL